MKEVRTEIGDNVFRKTRIGADSSIQCFLSWPTRQCVWADTLNQVDDQVFNLAVGPIKVHIYEASKYETSKYETSKD